MNLFKQYENYMKEMLCRIMPFFKFYQEHKWGFMFDEDIAVLEKIDKESNSLKFNIAAIDFAIKE